MGYIGLPTAVLAPSGYTVNSVDINQDLLEMIKLGKSPFNEPVLGAITKSINRDKLQVYNKTQQQIFTLFVFQRLLRLTGTTVEPDLSHELMRLMA